MTPPPSSLPGLPGEVRRLGVVGTLVWDRIWTLEDIRSGAAFESWGGIAYSLAAAAAACPPDWEIVTIMKVGADLETEARAFLGSLPGVRLDSILVVPQENNRVELRYSDGARRAERQSGGIPPWGAEEIRAHVRDLDALYVNFISGFELSLEGARAVRDTFRGPIYADLHSLFLGCPGAGSRERRRLPDWERWVSCFDAVQLNEEELATLSSGAAVLDWQSGARALVAAGARLVTVTLGAEGAGVAGAARLPADPLQWAGQGAEAADAVECSHPPAPRRVEGDPTGCGDVWGITFFFSLLAGADVHRAVQKAHAAASRKLERRGASDLFPHLAGAGSDG